MARFVTSNKRDGDDKLRQKMKSYWKVYSPTLESMMLSHDATYLAENEQNEILSYLPPCHGKRVLELGAGIGRFTSKLAMMSSHVTAVDFIEEYINENEKENKHLGNVSFKCADVTKLEFPEGSFDIIFSNWLFMYLSDTETSLVFNKIINWLSPGGYFFLRESCYHQSGNMKREENPTLYRTPLEYCQMLHESSSTDKAVYKIIRGKSILAYIHHSANPNQMCFLAKRVDGLESDHLTQFLQSRYDVSYIRAMERIFGYSWCSTGGQFTTRDFCSRLGLRPGQRVLDVGCGTGGSAVYMARHYGVHVHGVDLSTNMIHVAIERQGKLEVDLKKRLQFEISDILTVDYEQDSFDVIYSRDSILHIPDKQKLFQKLYRWLKPGGVIFLTDFCSGPQKPSEEFLNHCENIKHYHLFKVENYAAELAAAGFLRVESQDLKEEFIRLLETELRAFTSTREYFVKDFSQQDFDSITLNWTQQIRWTQEGQLTWGSFMARK